MAEPLVGDESISKYVERVFSRLSLAIEEIIMYGFQKSLRSPSPICEIPLSQRNPINAQRFKRTLTGIEPAWELQWTGNGFYES